MIIIGVGVAGGLQKCEKKGGVSKIPQTRHKILFESPLIVVKNLRKVTQNL